MVGQTIISDVSIVEVTNMKMNKKKEYENPVIDIIRFDNRDIVITSDSDGTITDPWDDLNPISETY